MKKKCLDTRSDSASPFVEISVEDRAQDLLDRFCVEAAVQDLFVRLSVQGVLGSPQKIPATNLKARSLVKLPIRDLWARSLQQISNYAMSLYKFST